MEESIKACDSDSHESSVFAEEALTRHQANQFTAESMLKGPIDRACELALVNGSRLMEKILLRKDCEQISLSQAAARPAI